MDSNKNLLYGAEKRLQEAMEQVDKVADDLLGRGIFAIVELKDIIESCMNNLQESKTEDLDRALILSDIVHDYVGKAQSTLIDIEIIAKRGLIEGGNANE